MKRLLLIFLVLSIAPVTQAKNDLVDKQAIEMIKKFYSDYMTAMANSDPKISSQNIKKCELLKEEYCTAKLLSTIPKLAKELDCDPIIYAQDSNLDCVKTLSVTKNRKKVNAYSVSYFYIDKYTKKKQITNINLTLAKQNGKYKIDSIWFKPH